MASPKRSRDARRRARKRRRQRLGTGASPVVRALTSSTLALPGLASSAAAESPALEIQTDYTYSNYKEDALDPSKVTPGGETSRYEIDIHQFRIASPIGERWDAAFDFTYETMTGATPCSTTIPSAKNRPSRAHR